MACIFGNSEDKEKIQELQSEITSLRKEIIGLKEQNEELKSNNKPSYDSDENEVSQKLVVETQKLDKLQNQYDNDVNQYKDDIEELKAQNKALEAARQLLQKKGKAQKQQITNLKQRLNEMNPSVNVVKSDDEKQQPITSGKRKQKKKKYNLNNLEDQIEIIHSEAAKAKAYELCVAKPVIKQSDNQTKEFGFMNFLDTSLSEKAVGQLFGKFKSKKVDAKQLASLLTLTVIIYQVKLHKMKTGATTKPELDSAKVKGIVEHMAVWIVRTYGQKSGDRKIISVPDDEGNIIKGEYDVYNVDFTKEIFARDIKEWVVKYVDCDGAL